MRSWRKPVREAAAAELAELGPDAINAVYQQFRRYEKFNAWKAVALVVVLCSAYVLFRVTHSPVDALLGFEYLVLGPLVWLQYHTAREAWRGLLCAASPVRSPDLIGVLVHVALLSGWHSDGGALTDAVAAAEAEHLALLDNRCMAGVRALMANSRDRRLVMALLELCARVGDSRELPAVRGLCRKGRVVSAACSGDPEVNQAAERARAAIEARLAATPEARKLVRPAAAPADGSAILLRPAHSVPVGDEGRLLRPVGANGNEAAPATDSAEAEQASVQQEQRGGA
jgi:hypothetical protein